MRLKELPTAEEIERCQAEQEGAPSQFEAGNIERGSRHFSSVFEAETPPDPLSDTGLFTIALDSALLDPQTGASDEVIQIEHQQP